MPLCYKERLRSSWKIGRFPLKTVIAKNPPDGVPINRQAEKTPLPNHETPNISCGYHTWEECTPIKLTKNGCISGDRCNSLATKDNLLHTGD